MGSVLSAVQARNSGNLWMMRSADHLDAALESLLATSRETYCGAYSP